MIGPPGFSALYTDERNTALSSEITVVEWAMFITPFTPCPASGDAFMTAQVFLRLLRLAAKAERTTLERLTEPFLDTTEAGA